MAKSYDKYTRLEYGPIDRPAWHAKVYGGSDGTVGRRSLPSKALRRNILAKQENKCLYCGHEFGSHVERNGKPVLVRLNWDHAAPFVYLQRNPESNWIAACSACNGIKHARVFDSLVEAQEFIRARRREKGYES